MIADHPLARLAALPGTTPAHALPVHLPCVVKMIVKSVAVPTLGGRVPGLVSRALAQRTIRSHVDESALAVTHHAPLLPVCGLNAPGHTLLNATGTVGCARALGATICRCNDCARVRLTLHGHTSPVTGHTNVAGLVTALPLTARGLGRSWWPGRSRRDHEEAVVVSCDRSNSGSKVEPAPAVAGGSIPLPTSSFTDLVRLFFSLSGPVAQRDAAVGSLLLAAGVTVVGVLPGPAYLVTPAAPVACSSAMPALGVSTPAGAASATASPG